MNDDKGGIRNFEATILERIEKLPYVSQYVHTRGWPFILAWCHRLTGIGLVIYLLLHIYTLHSLQTPDIYEAKMKILSFPFFVFLEWVLSIPVILHALNGGRLILFENFRARNDLLMIRCVAFLSVLYVIIVGLLMIIGNQNVSAIFFWLVVLAAAGSLSYILAALIKSRPHLIFWKLQRISAALLIVMVPAHIIFTHLNPAMAHDAHIVTTRMQHWFIKIVDLVLVLSILYHAGYGIFSISADYLKSGILRAGITGLISLGLLFIAAFAVKLTILI